ncbi:hypothetical protein UC34_11820 [Pandoraea vervacti]|uniref:BON domain-containing protein n=1 Tax=Pandoraea vervacti TaxID=656178 RepID=A0ABM5SYD7_9BURK|nr:BON domain-containing protein [Pandoraea vervacti]AJP57517.1 hypothetical protein UC34_11820 [Pandoraea vervacti]
MAKRIPPSPKPRQMREMASDEKQREQDQWQHQHHALTHEDGDAETSGAQPAEPDGEAPPQSHEARQSRERDAQSAHAHEQRDPKWLGASEPKRHGSKGDVEGERNGQAEGGQAGPDGRAKDSTSGSGGHGYAPEIAHGEESGYGPADAAPGAHPRFGRQSAYGPHDDYAGTGRDASGFANASEPVKSPSEARRVDWPEGTVGAQTIVHARDSSRSDAAIHEDIRKTLSNAIDLDISHVEVTVTSGLVLLTGYVPERWMQHVVQTEAAKVEGVLGVDNQLHERRVKAMSRPGESQEGHKI